MVELPRDKYEHGERQELVGEQMSQVELVIKVQNNKVKSKKKLIICTFQDPYQVDVNVRGRSGDDQNTTIPGELVSEEPGISSIVRTQLQLLKAELKNLKDKVAAEKVRPSVNEDRLDITERGLAVTGYNSIVIVCLILGLLALVFIIFFFIIYYKNEKSSRQRNRVLTEEIHNISVRLADPSYPFQPNPLLSPVQRPAPPPRPNRSTPVTYNAAHGTATII